MGYTTDFVGSFNIDKPLDQSTFDLINGLASTRRMKRKELDKSFGVDGEFYYNPSTKDSGQEQTSDIVDYNTPPSSQPSLWLQWRVEDDMKTIVWDGGEKFYNYVEWMQYLISNILAARGYTVSGEVEWFGEDRADRGLIRIKDNEISTLHAKTTWAED